MSVDIDAWNGKFWLMDISIGVLGCALTAMGIYGIPPDEILWLGIGIAGSLEAMGFAISAWCRDDEAYCDAVDGICTQYGIKTKQRDFVRALRLGNGVYEIDGVIMLGVEERADFITRDVLVQVSSVRQKSDNVLKFRKEMGVLLFVRGAGNEWHEKKPLAMAC